MFYIFSQEDPNPLFTFISVSQMVILDSDICTFASDILLAMINIIDINIYLLCTVIVILIVMRKHYQKDSLASMKNSGEIHEQLVTYDEEGGGEMDTNGYVEKKYIYFI